MRKLDNITLPLTNVIAVGKDDIKTLDFIFDLYVNNICSKLTAFHRYNLPGIIIMRSQCFRVVAILLFLPPKGIRKFKGQNYLVFAANTTGELLNFFNNWSHYNLDGQIQPLLGRVSDLLRKKQASSPLTDDEKKAFQIT
jgi:hypothetical protein